MLKQTSSFRNQKGRGYHSKVKLSLKICLLVAICIWLVYQATQFSNQKAALVGSSFKKEVVHPQAENGYKMLKLGRKNLDPRSNKVATSDSQKLQDDDRETETSVDGEIGAGNDDGSLGNQEKAEEGEHEQLEDLIDVDDSED
ncbi:OLC1v1017088C1 [Oldenlandia corymbosa var. corymbosa]|uniref:OLC1v1017088C1 n=1 Tax=Oldenlandia corymbosa var. corymbosa TaxID=529605 RepID=A0AAV1E8N8_OLDCO|nr:OLC1v1017088C1 [Oldenlandia corymbosa var. corymbosa]